MKKLLVILLLIAAFKTIGAQQLYTKGGYGQMYWDWRPDIADSCYEFTFINYKFTDTFSSNNIGCNAITLYYWDDCNYGKSYINANGLTSTYSNIPLHAFLYPTTSYPILDSFCGYPIIHNSPNFLQVKEPNRRKFIYKGLVYLPEKCKNWHFVQGVYYNQCHSPAATVLGPGVIFNETITFPVFNYSISNLDSVSFNPFTGQIIDMIDGTCGFYGCSFNNVDFPNNSSPRFLSPPMYSFPLQQEVEFNPGLYDPDHDSVDVRIVDSLRELFYFTTVFNSSFPFPIGGFSIVDINGNPSPGIMTRNIFYAPVLGAVGPTPQRYTPDNPFDTDSTFQLIHTTGKTTFKANSIMNPVLMYSAKDYRNHKFVSESYCVGQFTILNDTRILSYLQIDTASMQGAEFNSQGRIKVCAGYMASFDAYIKLPNDPSGNLVISTTADTTIPGNGICTIVNNHTDSVHLHFIWTPPAGTRGLYNVFVNAKDSNCNTPYHEFTQIYTWDFNVDTCEAPLSLSSAIKEEGNLILYPNPATNKLFITSDENISSVKICNLLSEPLLEKKVKGAKKLELNIDRLSTGVYMLNVNDKYFRKLIIER